MRRNEVFRGTVRLRGNGSPIVGKGKGGMQLSTGKEEEGISDGGRGRTRHGLGSGGAAIGDVARE